MQVAAGAFRHFTDDDGWAIASHIALSTLMALFPFLIVVTALAGFFLGSKELADEAALLLLEAWPSQVAEPIARDITGVLTSTRGDVLTLGVLFALYFASSGVESLRIGLNRAYGMKELRAWWLLRIESVIYVLVGAHSGRARPASLQRCCFGSLRVPLSAATWPTTPLPTCPCTRAWRRRWS